MIKTKIISFIVVLFTLLLSSCNEDKATVVDNVESHFQYLGENNSTRSCISDSILPLKENDSLKYLKELVAVGKIEEQKYCRQRLLKMISLPRICMLSVNYL